MEKIKTGILGCGMAAHLHAKALMLCPEREFVGVYGPITEQAKQFAQEYGVTSFNSREELFANCDCIHICTPSGLHFSDILSCLEAKKYVVCEKPICMTDEESEQVRNALQKSNALLMPISQNRYNKVFNLVRNTIAEGKIGKLLMANVKMMYNRSPEYYQEVAWRGTMREDGGTLMNQGIHGVDVALGILGKPVSVMATAKTLFHDIEAPDTVAALVELECGATLLIQSTTASDPGYPRSYSFYGTKGCIEMGEDNIIRWDVPGEEGLYVNTSSGKTGANDPSNVDNSLHAAQFTEFSKVISGEMEQQYTFEDAAMTLKVINATNISQKENRKVFL